MNFYEKFESICNEKGTTPSAVAKAAGFSNSVAAYWKSSGATPKSGTIQALAKTLGVSQEELLEAQNDETVISTTGMSQKALNAIKAMRNKSYKVAGANMDDKRHIIDIINLFLESDAELFFGYLQYLTCEKYILSVPVSWGDGPETAVIMLPETKKDEKPETKKDEKPETKKDEKHNQSETAKPIKDYPPFAAAEYFRNELHEELDKILKRMQKTIIDEERKKAHNAHT